MKIRLIIQKQYENPEIHICCSEENEETRSLQSRLENILLRKLVVYRDNRVESVPVADAVRIYAADKKVYVRTAENIYEIRERLYTLEQQLSDSGFVRISNSEIVNTASIQKLDMGLAGTIKMHMRNGDITYVSRRYVSTIRKKLIKTEDVK